MIAHAGGADETLALILAFTAIWLIWGARSRLKGVGFPRLPKPAAWTMIGVAAVLIVLATFLPRYLLGPQGIWVRAASVRPRSTATLSITEPTPGQVASGNQLTVVLDLKGGTIVQAASLKITPDTGHIHLSIDGSLVSMTYGTQQVLDVGYLKPGVHTLTAEFVAADHAPFVPDVRATVTFKTT